MEPTGMRRNERENESRTTLVRPKSAKIEANGNGTFLVEHFWWNIVGGTFLVEHFWFHGEPASLVG